MHPPVLKKKPYPHKIHNDIRIDNYAYVREKNEMIKKHIDAENHHTNVYFNTYSEIQNRIQDELEEYDTKTDVSIPIRYGQWWYVKREHAEYNYPIHSRFPVTSPDIPNVEPHYAMPDEQVIIDENHLNTLYEFCSIEQMEPSPNEKWMAVVIDTVGHEQHHLQFIPLGHTDRIQGIKNVTHFEWMDHPNHIMYVSADDKNRSYQVWCYDISKNHSQLLYEEDDELFSVTLSHSTNKNYILIDISSTHTSEVYVTTNKYKSPLRLIQKRSPNVIYKIDQANVKNNPYWFRLTNENAVEFKLQVYYESWHDIIVGKKFTLIDFHVFNNFMVWEIREHAQSSVLYSIFVDDSPDVIFSNISKNTRQIDGKIKPSTSHVIEKGSDWKSDFFRVSISSLIHPTQIIDFYPEIKRVVVRHKTRVPDYNPSDFITHQIWAPSSDGVLVPASIVYAKNLTPGPKPLVLYGYGSYDTCSDPIFSIHLLSLLKRGIIYVIAHVRGGGECGQMWYQSGKLEHKENTFNDFIAVARYLIHNEWTTSKKMVARGGSAGGLLMGTVMNREPGLFKAVIAEVPFVDVLSTMLDDSLPLSISEREEWGNPLDPRMYHIIKKYSPYDNIKPVLYPTLYVTSGWHDSRVGFWEPTKWVLALRDAHPKNRVYLSTEMGGHAGPTGRNEQYINEARVITFILNEMKQH
jgi:oligopeptidase B